MPAASGRTMWIKKNSTLIAGVRSKGFSFAGEPVDVTTDDELAKRTLLAASASEAVDLTCEGVTKDAVLRAVALGSGDKLLTDITIGDALGTIAGNFFLASYEETGAYQDAITFSCSLQSSGAWTYTPAGG
jgi:predicted secreted protein